MKRFKNLLLILIIIASIFNVANAESTGNESITTPTLESVATDKVTNDKSNVEEVKYALEGITINGSATAEVYGLTGAKVTDSETQDTGNKETNATSATAMSLPNYCESWLEFTGTNPVKGTLKFYQTGLDPIDSVSGNLTVIVITPSGPIQSGSTSFSKSNIWPLVTVNLASYTHPNNYPDGYTVLYSYSIVVTDAGEVGYLSGSAVAPK